MQSGVLSKAQLAAMLTAWAAAADADAGKVILFVNDYSPTYDTLIGALTQPTASWYTAADIDWGRVIEQDNGAMALDAGGYRFDYTGTDPACTIYGWGVTNTAGSKLLLSRRLDMPVVMANTYDSVIVEPDLVVPAVQAS